MVITYSLSYAQTTKLSAITLGLFINHKQGSKSTHVSFSQMAKKNPSSCASAVSFRRRTAAKQGGSSGGTSKHLPKKEGLSPSKGKPSTYGNNLQFKLRTNN